jgi:hypothetical protein
MSGFKNNNKLYKFKNIDPRFGESGPFEAESKEELAYSMIACFQDWAWDLMSADDEWSVLEDKVKLIHDEFIKSLIEV